MLEILLASFLTQIVFFVFALILKTDKVTDLAYGLGFTAIIWWLYFQLASPTHYHLVVAILITLWGVRLAAYLFTRILTMGRDKRFDGIRENTFAFTSFWLLQAMSIWVILLPTSYFFLNSSAILNDIMFWAGAAITLIGIGTETVADWQKFKFKYKAENKDAFIQNGVWKYLRHPNYFGEILAWWGLFITVASSIPVQDLWVAFGPAWITILLLFITGIPTLERTYAEKYKDNEEYQKYKESTKKIIPFIY